MRGTEQKKSCEASQIFGDCTSPRYKGGLQHQAWGKPHPSGPRTRPIKRDSTVDVAARAQAPVSADEEEFFLTGAH